MSDHEHDVDDYDDRDADDGKDDECIANSM